MTRTKTVAKGQDTKTKKSKTDARIKVNTCLLLILSVLFGAMTCCGISRIRAFNISATAFTISDGPGLCRYDGADPKDLGFMREEVYLCSLEHDEDGNYVEVTDVKDHTLYLNNKITFASEIISAQLKTILCIIGSMFTIASLIGTIVYWNHNRGR